MSEIPFDPELKALESALGDLVPAKSRVDRDRLMYQAGLLATQTPRYSRWLWPAIAAALAVVAGAEGLVLAARPHVRVIERVVVVREPAKGVDESPSPIVILSQSPQEPSSVQDSLSLTNSDALRLRGQMLRFGIDELPERPSLLTHSSGDVQPPATVPLFPGVLHRPDYQKLIDSGGSS